MEIEQHTTTPASGDRESVQSHNHSSQGFFHESPKSQGLFTCAHHMTYSMRVTEGSHNFSREMIWLLLPYVHNTHYQCIFTFYCSIIMCSLLLLHHSISTTQHCTSYINFSTFALHALHILPIIVQLHFILIPWPNHTMWHCGYLHYCFISVIFAFLRVLVLFISVLSHIRDFSMCFSSSYIYQYPQPNKKNNFEFTFEIKSQVQSAVEISQRYQSTFITVIVFHHLSCTHQYCMHYQSHP